MKKNNEKVVAIPPTVETRGLPCNNYRDHFPPYGGVII